jgi:hypothetical protein
MSLVGTLWRSPFLWRRECPIVACGGRAIAKHQGGLGQRGKAALSHAMTAPVVVRARDPNCDRGRMAFASTGEAE